MNNIEHMVYINNHYRKHLRVVSVTQRASLVTPATATISAPNEHLGLTTLRRWDIVNIYCDIHRNRKLVFTGFVWNRNISQGPGYCNLTYECVDSRVLLNTEVVARDFNKMSKRCNEYDSNEKAHARFIACTILMAFNANTGCGFGYNFTPFLTTYNGREYNFEGLTCADALDHLLVDNSYYEKPRFKVSYSGGTTNLFIEMFGIGYGRRTKVILAVKPENLYKSQPGGRPNVSNFNFAETIGAFINRIVCKGDSVQFQTKLKLEPAWDESELVAAHVQEVMLHRTIFCQPIINNQANPYYTKGNEYIGRLFRIPEVFLYNEITGINKAYHPVIDNSLAQNAGSIDSLTTACPYPHFIIIEYPKLIEEGGTPENGKAIIVEGYSIRQDKYVEFTKPLGKLTSDGTNYSWQFPDNLYLVCTVRDTQRVTYDSNKVGDEPYRITRRLNRKDFKYTEIRQGAKLNPSAWTTEDIESEEIRNDLDLMAIYSLAFLKETIKAPGLYHLTLPAFTTQYEIGDKISSNIGEISEKNIVEINYVLENEGQPVNDVSLSISG